MTEKNDTVKVKKTPNSNFPTDFLGDFGIGLDNNLGFCWRFHVKALQRFHLPITYMETNGDEDGIHYGKKQMVHDYIYETYYLSTDDCKFYVTTELRQIKNPFKALLVENSGAEKVKYKLDVCAIRLKDHQVFDIEIDGREHGTDRGMLKDRMRDKLLNFRYGIFTLRFDKYDEINFKKLDDFLNQPAMPYTRKRKIKGQKTPAPVGYDY